MNAITFSAQAKSSRGKKGGNEFISFVAKQFKQLTRRNLRIPIQLYNL